MGPVLQERINTIEAGLAEMQLIDPDEYGFYLRLWEDVQAQREASDYFGRITMYVSELTRRLMVLREQLRQTA